MNFLLFLQQFHGSIVIAQEDEKKEKRMKNTKLTCIIALILFVFALTAWGLPQEKTKPQTKTEKQEQVTKETPEETKKEKDKAETDDIADTMSKRMEEGDSLFKILGIPEPDDYMPTAFEIFLLWLIPASALAGITVLIVVLSKRRHERMLAMIEKGIVPGTSEKSQYKIAPFRWDVFTLFTGLILSLGGLGFSIFKIGEEGFQKWYSGVIPLLLGIAFLIFHFVYFKSKK
jgi:cell division protein FtsB